MHTRARKIQGERVNDARRIDERFCGTQPGDDGPVLGRLRSFGPIVGLVVGHFGEWNDGLERVVSPPTKSVALIAPLNVAISPKSLRAKSLNVVLNVSSVSVTAMFLTAIDYLF